MSECASWTAAVLLAITAAGPIAAHPVVAGFERFYNGGSGEAAVGGQILLSELNCVSCHQAKAGRKAAPVLDGVGSRVKPGYLRTFLSSPHTVKPGTAMPEIFVGDPEKAQKVEALVHFLASTGSPRQERPERKLISKGKDLYHKVGCVACHGTRDAKGDAAKVLADSVPLGDLKAKYTLGSLRFFLENPHEARPGGRMPSLLNAKEAAEVANYLMQGVTVPAAGFGTNLKYAYYEGEWEKLPDFTKYKPVATGEAEDFDVHVARREHNMALKFEGFLNLPRAGAYQFHLHSDDGSRLWIDGKLVVDNDGVHAPDTKSATAELFKGTHKLVVGVFNAGGGVELGVEIEGPGMGRQPIGPLVSLKEETTARAAPSDAMDDSRLVIDAGLADKGRALFSTAGCVNCHALKLKGAAPVPATPLAKLRPSGGCLAEHSARGVPWFFLSAAQRTALAAALRSPASAAPVDVVHRTLVGFNCYACHERGKIGGIEEGLSSFFTTTQQEMGEEGRVPPSLNGVGAKLTAQYLKKILDKGAHDRPYMNTRMPGFGAANVGHLVTLFANLDPAPSVAAVEISQPLPRVKAEARHLVGAQALGCVRCHTFAGKKAEGVQGIDMILMPQRLQREWFHRYLLNPTAFRPGTRMPASWPDGQSLLPKVLDGQAATQIEAIWTYLRDGTKAQVPVGTNKQFIPLVPASEAILYRNFIEGAGTRAIGVGYPEKANVGFDANDLRLALVWQGAFIDAAKHWTDRGSGFEGPLGDNIVHLPAGVAFAVLDGAAESWPTQKARELGYRFRGYTLTPDQRPTFRYTVAGVEVEDRPDAVVRDAQPGIRRTLKLVGRAPDHLYFRAAVGKQIEAVGDGWYRVNREYRIKIEGGEAELQHPGDLTELRVRVRFRAGQAQIVEEIGW